MADIPSATSASPCPVSASGRSAIDVALEASGIAGSILTSRFGSPGAVTPKGRGNVVTAVDVAAEEAVADVLRREYPTVPVLGEESGRQIDADRGWVWIVDPIDGTRNFASSVPHFSTVIALVHDGDVMAGVTHDPIRGETFYALRGHGAFLNGMRIRVASDKTLVDGILGLDLSYSDHGAADQLRLVLDLWPGMQTVRILGSAALGLAYVAAGRFHVFFHHKLESWDQAAGLLLVAEAGGLVTDGHGRAAALSSDGTIAASPILHTEFINLIAQSAWTTHSSVSPAPRRCSPP